MCGGGELKRVVNGKRDVQKASDVQQMEKQS